jgi:hypothetical protein
MSSRVWRVRVRLLSIGTVVGAIVVYIAMVASLAALVPRDWAAVQLRSPVPPGDEISEVNRVSHWRPATNDRRTPHRCGRGPDRRKVL